MCQKFNIRECGIMRNSQSSLKILWALTALSSFKNFGKEIKNLNMLIEMNVNKSRRAPLFRTIEIMDNVTTLRMRKNNMLAVKEGVVRAFRKLTDKEKKLLYFKCILKCGIEKMAEISEFAEFDLSSDFGDAAKHFSENLEIETVFDIGVLSSEDWLKKQYTKTCRSDRKYILSDKQAL